MLFEYYDRTGSVPGFRIFYWRVRGVWTFEVFKDVYDDGVLQFHPTETNMTLPISAFGLCRETMLVY